MGKKTFYRQCRLNKGGHLDQVSWIPEQFAVMDKVLKLRNEGGDWDNGWKVTGVGETRLEQPPHSEGLIRNHRKATGDSLPK